ncbi:LysR substrate-binding domain-containing protein [Limnohabitans sp.]|uniref:LysR family transcriptional regulator n=1 Tax=Limnohabitans sp. TaxID=1907725 RepID=UPI00286FA327|nr:LysR substrate-binding domain-containing protein [Limnohabitans sp.]
MKLDQLQHLIAIVEQGSLRAAAKRLDVPQPALTRSIRSLEKELGVDLFARQTTGMSLTAEGRRFQVRASAIVNEARRAKEEIQLVRGDYEGTVSAALSIMPHVGMLPSTLPVFNRTYPKVRLRISENLLPAVESALREGSVDFYLGAAPHQSPSAGLTMQHLCDNTRVVVGRKNHPLLKATHLKELAQADWATTAIDYNAEEDLARLFGNYQLPAPRVMFQARSAMSVLVALAQTDLLAMLPVQWIHNPMTRDLLQAFSLEEKIPAPSIVLVRRVDLPLTPPAEFFCDVLLRNLPTR